MSDPVPLGDMLPQVLSQTLTRALAVREQKRKEEANAEEAKRQAKWRDLATCIRCAIAPEMLILASAELHRAIDEEEAPKRFKGAGECTFDVQLTLPGLGKLVARFVFSTTGGWSRYLLNENGNLDAAWGIYTNKHEDELYWLTLDEALLRLHDKAHPPSEESDDDGIPF
jgi:hypothetical protein